MIFPVRGSRDNPNAVLERLVRSVTAGESTVIGRVSSMNTTFSDFLQQRPLTGADLESVVGTPDEFFDEFNKFQQRYFAAIDRLSTSTRSSLVGNLTKKRRMIDLSIFDRTTAEELLKDFNRNVLKMDQLIARFGLPNRVMPNANNFRFPLMFDMDSSEITHPIQLLYNSMMLNFDPEKTGTAALSVPRSLMSASTLEAMFERMSGPVSTTSGVSIFGDLPAAGEVKKIVTFDTEGTGVLDSSQVRSLAGSIYTINDTGEIIGIEKLDDINFGSAQLNSMNAVLNDSVMSFNNFIANIETGRDATDMGEGGKDFLDSASSFLRRITSPDIDVISGHNIEGYDIDKLIKTMLGQSGFASHSDAADAISHFYNVTQVERPGLVVDTLPYARFYIQQQVNELENLVRNSGGVIDEGFRNRNLYAPEILARVDIGGSATYGSMENISLNTNLFELIEEQLSDEQMDDLMVKLSRGSHVADVDEILQTYMAINIQTGRLQIRGLMNLTSGAVGGSGEASWESDFGKYMRGVIYKSQAITPTTNIASVNQMHAQVRDYLKTEEGSKGVRLSLRQTDDFLDETQKARIFGTEDTGIRKGILKYDRGRSKYVFEGETISTSATGELVRGVVRRDIDESDARNVIQTVINQAQDDLSATRGTASTVDMAIKGSRRSVPRSLANEAIVGTSVSFGTQSKLIELLGRRALDPVLVGEKADDISEIENVLGSSIETFGRKRELPKRFGRKVKSILTGEGATVYERGGVANVSVQTASEVANKFKGIGDVYADVLDVHSRMFSTILARATAHIGKQAGMEVVTSAAPELVTDTLNQVKYTQHADVLAEMGISFFKAQDKFRLTDPAMQTGVAKSRIMMPVSLVEEMVTRGLEAETPGARLADDSFKVGFSVVPAEADRAAKLNVFLKVDQLKVVDASGEVRALKREELTRATSWLVGTVNEGIESGNLSEDLAALIPEEMMSDLVSFTRKSAEEGSTLVENIVESMIERGVVIAAADEEASADIIRAGISMGLQSENDFILNATAEVARTGTGLADDTVVLGPTIFGDVRTNAEDIIRATEGASAPPKATPSDQIMAANRVANVISESEGSSDRIGRRVKLATESDGEVGSLAKFYLSHKKGIRNTFLGAAAAGIGYYLYNRNKETQLYNETLETQPMSPAKRYPVSQSAFNNYTSSRGRGSDPLATAGVVGNLDRMRIGHTQMGNDRHDHLFGR